MSSERASCLSLTPFAFFALRDMRDGELRQPECPHMLRTQAALAALYPPLPSDVLNQVGLAVYLRSMRADMLRDGLLTVVAIIDDTLTVAPSAN